MSDFFKMMWRKGLKFLLVVVLVWLVFFLINFFYPSFFNSLRGKNSLPGETVEQKESIPLRFRIYNLFFRGSLQNPLKLTNNATTSSSTENVRDKNAVYVWGATTSTTLRNKNRLNAEDLYIYANKSGSIVKDFKIDGVLVKEKGVNNITSNSIITGNIDTGYLSSYYFTVDIYDSNGDFLYGILGNGYKDIKEENILNITAVNNKNNDYSNPKYTGDGFMVIWSDNPEVESVLITKIKIN